MFDFDKIWQMIKRLRVSSAPPPTHTHPLPIPPFHSLLHDMAQGKGFFTLEVHSSTTHEVMLQTRSCALSNPSRRRRQGLSLNRQERLKVFLKKKKKSCRWTVEFLKFASKHWISCWKTCYLCVHLEEEPACWGLFDPRGLGERRSGQGGGLGEAIQITFCHVSSPTNTRLNYFYTINI